MDFITMVFIFVAFMCFMGFLAGMYKMTADKDIELARIEANCAKVVETPVYTTPSYETPPSR